MKAEIERAAAEVRAAMEKAKSSADNNVAVPKSSEKVATPANEQKATEEEAASTSRFDSSFRLIRLFVWTFVPIN